MLASLSSSITTGIAHHGVYTVFGLMLIDAVFPAFSELVMLYAGALAAGAIGSEHPLLFGSSLSFGATAFLVLALAGTLGYLAGGLIGWLIGIYGGRPLILRHGRWLHLNQRRIDAAERRFDRYGSAFVLLGRITPLLRSFVSIPAGIFRVPLGRYSLLTLLGSAIWAFAFAGAGYGLGTGYQRVHNDFRYAEYAVVAAVLFLALLVRRQLLPARRQRRPANE